MARARKPTVYLCLGKDCRKHKKALRALADALSGRAHVVEVGCQKICDGPVCGLRIGGELVWLEEVDSSKRRAALLQSLGAEQLPAALKKRRVKKRQGKLRD